MRYSLCFLFGFYLNMVMKSQKQFKLLSISLHLLRQLSTIISRGINKMDSIQALVLFVNSLMACHAMPMSETRLAGQDYQIREWTCSVDKGPVLVKAWSNWCEGNGGKYLGRVFYLQIGDYAFYRNRFAEVQSGYGASVMDAYQSPCGS